MTTKIIKIHSIQLVLCVKATSDFCKFAFGGSRFHWYLLMFYRFLDWAPLHPKSSEYWKSVCFYWTNDRWILLCVEVYFIFLLISIDVLSILDWSSLHPKSSEWLKSVGFNWTNDILVLWVWAGRERVGRVDGREGAVQASPANSAQPNPASLATPNPG